MNEYLRVAIGVVLIVLALGVVFSIYDWFLQGRHKLIKEEEMSEYKQFVYVVLTLIVFMFMFRYDVTEPSEGPTVYRLDRWTGEVNLCTTGCSGWL